MKQSKRKITARKIMLNRNRKLIRICKKCPIAFAKLFMPKLMIYPNVNPFSFIEGIKASHRINIVPRKSKFDFIAPTFVYPRKTGIDQFKEMLRIIACP